MRVLIACEFSGIVREAFKARGHDAWSCDLLPTEREGNHLQCDVRTVLEDGWDLMVAHPPCTYLCVSGARWWKDRRAEQAKAIEFVEELRDAPIEKVAIENPVGILPKFIGGPTQIIEPRWFGEVVSKKTCLWLYNLPTLKSNISDWVIETVDSIHREPPSPERWKNRSRFFPGIAKAFAEQWG